MSRSRKSIVSGIAKRGPKRATPVVSRRSTVSKWGNSLGVRIPQDAARQLKLKEGEEIDVEIRQDSIIIRPLRKRWSEAELLKGVTPEIAGGEIDWGRPVGKEVW